jgi:hypothetical protein
MIRGVPAGQRPSPCLPVPGRSGRWRARRDTHVTRRREDGVPGKAPRPTGGWAAGPCRCTLSAAPVVVGTDVVRDHPAGGSVSGSPRIRACPRSNRDGWRVGLGCRRGLSGRSARHRRSRPCGGSVCASWGRLRRGRRHGGCQTLRRRPAVYPSTQHGPRRAPRDFGPRPDGGEAVGGGVRRLRGRTTSVPRVVSRSCPQHFLRPPAVGPQQPRGVGSDPPAPGPLGVAAGRRVPTRRVVVHHAGLRLISSAGRAGHEVGAAEWSGRHAVGCAGPADRAYRGRRARGEGDVQPGRADALQVSAVPPVRLPGQLAYRRVAGAAAGGRRGGVVSRPAALR